MANIERIVHSKQIQKAGPGEGEVEFARATRSRICLHVPLMHDFLFTKVVLGAQD